MKRIKEIRIVLSFVLLASFSTLALAYFCAVNLDVIFKEYAKICGDADVRLTVMPLNQKVLY